MTAEAPRLMFQAIGCVTGTLIKGEDDRHTLLTEYGEVPVYSIRGKLLHWLKKNPEQCSGQWSIYPRSRIDAELQSVSLRAFDAQSSCSPNQLRVSGRVVYQKKGLIGIRIEPNIEIVEGREETRWSNPFTITVEGYLPEQAIGQFWQMEVDVETGKLVMQDALKLADAEPRPEAKHKRKPRQIAERRSKPEPPIKKRTTNANQPEPATECA